MFQRFLVAAADDVERVPYAGKAVGKDMGLSLPRACGGSVSASVQGASLLPLGVVFRTDDSALPDCKHLCAEFDEFSLRCRITFGAWGGCFL